MQPAAMRAGVLLLAAQFPGQRHAAATASGPSTKPGST
jgi:hypothetical protein